MVARLLRLASIFQLQEGVVVNIQLVLLEGKAILSDKGFAALGQHESQFIRVTDELLKELEEVMA